MTATRRAAGTTRPGGAATKAARNAQGRNRVRIIGGEWRSRIVRFPPAAQLRPTPDRVRETLFNWLGQRLHGLECLDLFAGSGALGFEAASRGAASVTLVERDRDTARHLRASAAELGASQVRVVEADALAFLARDAGSYDVVFLDPPYASGLAAAAFERLAPRLKPGARVYAESATPLEPGPQWLAVREGRAGAVRYALYEMLPP
jgi:16S rRNA (guanine966-N2)-methyltransferase